MSKSDVSKDASNNTKTLIGKGGPIAGSLISILGSLLILIGFVLPWASCSGQTISGLNLASQGSDLTGESSTFFLYLVPFFAVGVLGVAILVIPATLWKKLPPMIKTIGTLLVCLLAVFACCPASVFFYRMQSAVSDSSMYGTSFVRVDYGFYISLFGIVIAFLGGLIALGTSVVDLMMSRKKPPEIPAKK